VIAQKMRKEASLKIGLLVTLFVVAAWTSWHRWHTGGGGITGTPLIVFSALPTVYAALHNRSKYMR
jgi:hypothetical protein